MIQRENDVEGILCRRTGIITPPLQDAGLVPLSNLVAIVSTFSDLEIVTGNCGMKLFDGKTQPSNIKIYSINYPIEKNPFVKVIRYLTGQVKYTFLIFKHRHLVRTWIFFIGETMPFPMLAAVILKKNVFLSIAGSLSRAAKFSEDFFLIPTKLLSSLSHRIAGHIILYSPNLVTEWSLTPYRPKILIAHEHYLDFATFTVTTPYPDRPPLIGYIGRLSGEKGVQHFVQALPAILSNNQDLRVLIGGDGRLKDAIETSLQENGIINRVDLPGWISHDDLPKYLNQLRLLILPSYTEGLPNIMLEAMACGTPVLATPVGAIPDIIRDGETGFIMENNSPECIARNVLRALTHPDLEGIAEKGRQYVEREFTFEKAVERWRGILQDIQ